MTILMRPSLIDTTHHCNDAHAGLLLTRGLTEWQTGEKTLKAALIDKVASVPVSYTHLTLPTSDLV